MKAAVCTAFGPPEALEVMEWPLPGPGPGQLSIRVRAAAVNFPDVLRIQRLYQQVDALPFVPGSEVAGIVEAVPPDVQDFAVGDRVIAWTSSGGFQEVAVARASRCHHLPPGMDFATGASLFMTYATSLYALKHRGRLKAGETMLVLGAASGVGFAAVEIGKSMGARVIACASSQARVDFALSAGADQGYVYAATLDSRDGQRQMTDALKRLAGDRGIDVVYDPVGGPYSEAALRAIAWGGRFLVVGFAASKDIPRIPLNLPLLKGCDVVGVLLGAAKRHDPALGRALEQEAIELWTQGHVRPRVERRFPLAETGAALRLMMDRGVLGKVVVEME